MSDSEIGGEPAISYRNLRPNLTHSSLYLSRTAGSLIRCESCPRFMGSGGHWSIYYYAHAQRRSTMHKTQFLLESSLGEAFLFR